MASWTKKEIVKSAFEEIGLSSYVYDLQPEQLQSAVTRLDSLMASLNAKGVRLGYPLFSNPSSVNLNDDTELPDYAVGTIIAMLAIRIAPTVGKEVSIDTRSVAKQGMTTLLSISATAQSE